MCIRIDEVRERRRRRGRRGANRSCCHFRLFADMLKPVADKETEAEGYLTVIIVLMMGLLRPELVWQEQGA